MKSVLRIMCVVIGVAAGSLFAQPADAQAEKIANLRKMISLTGGAKIIDQMFTAMAAQMTDPKQQEILQQFRKELDINQIYDIMIPAWAKYLDNEDIKQVIVFYESPAGKKLLDAQPKVVADSMPQIMAWSQEISKRLMEKMKEKGVQ